jgi:hypothetical protein
MERIVIVSILSALLVQLTAARATAEGNYKKICRVSENLRVLDDSADANSCRAIAVDSQAQEYQIGCRDSENMGTIIVTAPFNITDKAARVTSSKLAAHAQNTATPDQFTQCAKAWGSRENQINSSDIDVRYWPKADMRTAVPDGENSRCEPMVDDSATVDPIAEMVRKKTWAEIWAMRAEELRADDVELDEHADVFNLSENHKTMEMK